MTALVSGPSFTYDPVTLARERRPRMLASLLLSSVLVPLAFLAAGWLARWIPSQRPREIVVPISDFQLAPSPPSPAPASPAAPPRIRIRAAALGILVPRAEAPLDASVLPPGDGEPDAPAGARQGGIVLGGPAGESDRPINLPGQPLLADRLPNPVRSVKPVYPELARDARLEGLVVVFALVGRDGRVLDARLDPERHAPLLDAAALAAARQWRFEPASSGGHTVAAWVSLPFRFVLHGE
jgi:periplasmic protein TonB